jgi:hypothetical protein
MKILQHHQAATEFRVNIATSFVEQSLRILIIIDASAKPELRAVCKSQNFSLQQAAEPGSQALAF